MFIQAKKRLFPIAPFLTILLIAFFCFYFYLIERKTTPDFFPQLLPILVFVGLIIVFFLIYFIIALLDFLKPFRDKNAGITIDDAGLDDNLSIFSLGFIPWNNIQGAKIVKLYSISLIIIYLQNDKDILLSQPYWKRYFLNRWKKKWGGPVAISEKRISYDIISLTKSINAKAGGFKS